MVDDTTPEILEFHVASYKNLRDLRIPWSDRLAIYGQNGTGKTNLLEAFALCFGSTATTWQLSLRAEIPSPGAFSCLVRSGTADLPLAPAFCLRTDPDGRLSPVAESSSGRDSARFWQLLGADHAAGASWGEAVRLSVADPRLASLLTQLGHRPLVRYTLEDIHGLTLAAKVDRGGWIAGKTGEGPGQVRFVRRFSRTLAMPGPIPQWLEDGAADLPVPFAPLARWLSEPVELRSPYPDLLELTPADSAPVQAVWLSAERTASEAWFDFAAAMQTAEPAAERLRRGLDRIRLLPTTAEAHGNENPADESSFWMVARAERAINDTLSDVFGYTHALAEEAGASALSFFREPEFVSSSFVGMIDDPGLFARFSSGERTWIDLALAHAAAQLEALAALATWTWLGLSALPEEMLLRAALDLHDSVEAARGAISWQPHELDEALAYLERLVSSARHAIELVYPDDPIAQQAMNDSFPFLFPGMEAAVRPPLMVHLYDEPERHLHPAAQRRVQEKLSQPAREDIVVTTHSHLFLGRSGWSHLHLGKTGQGVAATQFEPSALEASSPLTHEMGLTRGELLNRFRYVLFVEGPVDAIVLHELFGPLLTEVGVLVLPLHGVNEAAALAEMELIGRIVDVGAGLLVDHARSDWSELATSRPQARSKEEQALIDLRRRLKKRGRAMDLFGLEREDIIAYLHDTALQLEIPGFAGWSAVEADRRRSEKLKDAVARHMPPNVHLGRRLIGRVAARMRAEGLAPPGDLLERVADVVAAAERSGI